jgi:hypothetical protein
VNPFFDEREERPRAFCRLLFQVALCAGAVAFSRLGGLSIWGVLYRRLAASGATENPAWPTSLFLAIQVGLLLVAVFSVWFSARLLGQTLALGIGTTRRWGVVAAAQLRTFSLHLADIGDFPNRTDGRWGRGYRGIRTMREDAPFFPITGRYEHPLVSAYKASLSNRLRYSNLYPDFQNNARP